MNVRIVILIACISVLTGTVSSATAQQSKTLTGTISDAACGAKHTMKNMTDAECARMCAAQGKYGLVVGKDVYTLEGHEADLGKLAAQRVTVTGIVNGKTLAVQSVALAKKAA